MDDVLYFSNNFLDFAFLDKEKSITSKIISKKEKQAIHFGYSRFVTKDKRIIIKAKIFKKVRIGKIALYTR